MSEIRTGDDFKATFPQLGILPSHALAAVRQPSTVHIVTIDDTDVIGLYLAPDEHAEGAFMLSVVGIPGNHLTCGFRFYDDIHPDPTAVDLIDILKLIIDRFGREFDLFGRRNTFLLHERISLKKKPESIAHAVPRHSMGTSRMFFKISETDDREFPFLAICALCFVIDTEQYTAYLQSHEPRSPR